VTFRAYPRFNFSKIGIESNHRQDWIKITAIILNLKLFPRIFSRENFSYFCQSL